jgi:hypothetical protein
MEERKYTVPVDVTIRVSFDVMANNQFDAIKKVEGLDIEWIFPQWRIVNVVIPEVEVIDAEIIPDNESLSKALMCSNSRKVFF